LNSAHTTARTGVCVLDPVTQISDELLRKALAPHGAADITKERIVLGKGWAARRTLVQTSIEREMSWLDQLSPVEIMHSSLPGGNRRDPFNERPSLLRRRFMLALDKALPRPFAEAAQSNYLMLHINLLEPGGDGEPVEEDPEVVDIDMSPLTAAQRAVVSDLWDEDQDQDEVHCKVNLFRSCTLCVAHHRLLLLLHYHMLALTAYFPRPFTYTLRSSTPQFH
jgi:hypothetical protein